MFYANTSGLYYDEGSTGYYTASSVNTGIAECANNIDGDPLFQDKTNDDYHLRLGSPAIDAGDPDGTRADIGALFFPQGIFVGISMVPQDEYSGDVDINYSIY